MPTKIFYFKCNNCGEEYKTLDEAEQCEKYDGWREE